MRRDFRGFSLKNSIEVIDGLCRHVGGFFLVSRFGSLATPNPFSFKLTQKEGSEDLSITSVNVSTCLI